MNFVDNIKNETLIICKSFFKNKILLSNKLLPIKIMLMDEFLKKYLFDYDENTVLYVMNKYEVKYDVALMYINNLYYIDDRDYEQPKLDFLVKLKK